MTFSVAAPASAQGFIDQIAGFFTGSSDEEVGVEVETPNVEAQGPAGIVASDDGLLIIDTLNRRLVRVNRDGTLIDTLELSEVLRPVDVAIVEQIIYVLDSLGRKVATYNETGDLLQTFGLPDTIDLNGTISLTIGGPDDVRVSVGAREARLDAAQARGGEVSVTLEGARSVATPDGLVESALERIGDDRLALSLSDADGLAARGGAASIEIASSGFLAGARLLAVDDQGRAYVLVDELPGDGSLAPRTVVKRYNAAGELTGEAIVPLDDADYIPNRPVTVTSDGRVFALIPAADAVSLVELDLDSRSALPPLDGSDDDAAGLEVPAPFEEAVSRAYADDMLVPRGQTSRDEIIERAEAYLEASWVLGAQNYPEGGTASRCEPASGALWRRPPRLDGQVGMTLVGLPYKWGGYDSLEGFARKLERGDLAGDVCTCRSAEHNYCLVWNAGGVDCSGFVSRALGAEYHTTSRLHEITTKLDRWSDLKRGDIINRRGRHVRLVTGVSTEGAVVVHVIESAVSCGGMCRASYEVSQLRGYEPRRYNFLADP